MCIRNTKICPVLTSLVASCTMNKVRALSSAVRAFGLHPKGRPFKSDSAHHCDASPFSGDVVQLVRTLPCHGRGREFESRRPRHSFQKITDGCFGASVSSPQIYPPRGSTS